MNVCLAILFVGLIGSPAQAISPVQKVIQLLGECKAKVAKDLAAEQAAMEEYTTFCDDELKAKGYAIETATREIEEETAAIDNNNAISAAKTDEIATLGTSIAGKERELAAATASRASQTEVFVAAEKELVKSVDECSRAVAALSKGMAFMQTGKKQEAQKELQAVRSALAAMIEGVSIETQSKRKLKSFLQSTSGDNDDLTLKQPQAKMVAYESKSGFILQTVKDMQAKAEAELSDLRKKDVTDAHDFKMIESGLTAEIAHDNEKVAAAKGALTGAQQALGAAELDLAAATKTKAVDTDYSSSLKMECALTAREWDARQASGKEEMAAIDKASEILMTGVVAFAQVGVKTKLLSDDDDDADESSSVRSRLSSKLQGLGKKYHSFALMQLAGAAKSDPFVKVRGLIESMIAKLMKEAAEEANQKAFCDEEMSSSTKSKEIKTATMAKLQSRMDQAATTMATLGEEVAALQGEIAEIDSAQATATEIRTKENTDNVKAMSDFQDSAAAVMQAMVVLKNFYGSLLQVEAKVVLKSASKQPSFGSAKSDSGNSIISVLEVAESDFTRLYAETETEEDAAAAAYKKLSEENALAKTTKSTDIKGKESEIKSLKVSLSQHSEDHDAVSEELDAVNAYLDKLKPQCESKVMSYAEKKAAREAEISGLKEALSILEGTGVAFLSFKRHY
jgi:chromosome segregation ATPase